MNRSIGRLALLAATTATLVVTAAPPAAATVAEPSPEQQLMSLLVAETNQQRYAAGCAPLAVDPLLVVASLRQSGYMAATGTFGHLGGNRSTFLTRARAAGYAYPAGENIAWGFTSPADVVAAWMASPAHRANILNCEARSFGAGVRFGADGTPYWTQVFGWR
jgi:uncharacterized protein YkwD